MSIYALGGAEKELIVAGGEASELKFTVSVDSSVPLAEKRRI